MQLIFLPAFACQRNVVLLLLLRATAKQNDNPFPVFSEVNPVAWAKVDAVFKDSAADTLHIREIPQSQAIKGGRYTACGLGIQPVKPRSEEISPVPAKIFPDVDHLFDGSIYFPIMPDGRGCLGPAFGTWETKTFPTLIADNYLPTAHNLNQWSERERGQTMVERQKTSRGNRSNLSGIRPVRTPLTPNS